MSGAGFLRIKKLKGQSIIKKAAGHNKRSIPTDEKVDPKRTHLNYAIDGPATAGDVAQLAKDLMAAAGLNEIRKDAVRGIEIVFSLARNHQLNERDYFTNCATWAALYYGGVILSIDVHKDESAPHCHLILLPLVNGRMVGNKLIGYVKELSAMQAQFHLEVASKYGLSKSPPKLTGEAKEAAVKAVLEKMRETGDKALQSAVWAVIRDSIESDPAPFVAAMGIELQAPKKKLRTMAQIFTSKGKGKSKEGLNTIAFAPSKKEQRLCSVAFAGTAPPQPIVKLIRMEHGLPPTPPKAEVVLPEVPFIELTTRHRDADQAPDRYDSYSGDYFAPPPPAPRQHLRAVTHAMAGLQH